MVLCFRHTRKQLAHQKKSKVFPSSDPPVYFTVYFLYLINRASPDTRKTHIKLHSSLLQRFHPFRLPLVHSLFQPGEPFSPSDHYTIGVTTRLFTIKTGEWGEKKILRFREKEEIKAARLSPSGFSFHFKRRRRRKNVQPLHFNFIPSSRVSRNDRTHLPISANINDSRNSRGIIQFQIGALESRRRKLGQ